MKKGSYMNKFYLFLKRILIILFLNLISGTVISQKVTVQVIKLEKSALSEWQIMDEQYQIIISGNQYSGIDSATFTLEANKRYFLMISVFEIYIPDKILYSLMLNGEPVVLINSGTEAEDRLFPFFTGIRTYDTKITGGTNAVISDFPWQVYYIAGNYRCGGSIISENWIVTAAHCTKNSTGGAILPSDMSVIAGTNNPYNMLDGKTYYVSEVIVNENYDSQTLENDIALLKLKGPVNVVNAAPIKLITAADVAAGATDPGVMSWVTGWGLTHVSPSVFPAKLQKVQLPIVTNAQAATVWSTIPKSDIMAGYLNGNKDACSGDSGGPMVVPVFGEYKLAGIVSWGSSNCNTYGGYTRESGFENWIRVKTGILSEYKPPSPAGESLICSGAESSQYSIEKLAGASAYEWKLFPDDAGVISGNSENAAVLWNKNYAGTVSVILRVTINNIVSDWSKLNVKIVQNTKLLSQSGDTTICAGQPVNLSAGAEGYNLVYKWYHDGRLFKTETSGQINISSTSADDSGDYLCEIAGACGTIFTNHMKLTILPVTRISYISPDSAVPFGGDLTLEVNSEGHDLKYQWQKDNALIENSNASQLLLQNVNATDIGLYKTTVTGTCGTETSDTIYVYIKKEDNSDFPEIFMWPTITSNEFNVALNNDTHYNVYIFNIMGRLLKEYKECRYQTKIDVSYLPGGVFIIKVFNNNFQKSYKLIKE
jgi:hypothetical protein